MDLAEPKFLGVQGILGLSVVGRDQARDDRFIAAVREEFHNVQNRQILSPEAPSQAPHLILASQSSQLSLSAAQAEFQVQFYGDYIEDIPKGLGYVQRKLLSVFNALEAVGAGTTSIGVVAKFNFPDLTGDPQAAPTHVMKTLTRVEVPVDHLEDAQVRIALRVRDIYFVHLGVANYEMRQFEQPIRPGPQRIRLRPWLGTVTETGVELNVDINNKLEARLKGEDPELTAEGVTAVIGMLNDVATKSGRQFAETGDIAIDSIVASSEAQAK